MNEYTLVVEKLDVLAGLRDSLAHWQAEKQKAIDEAIPQEVRAKLAEIDAEFDDQIHVANVNIASVTADIKAMVLLLKCTITGSMLQAVWSRGRRKWDSDRLQEYAKDHSEIWAFYDEGQPSISIKEVKK